MVLLSGCGSVLDGSDGSTPTPETTDGTPVNSSATPSEEAVEAVANVRSSAPDRPIEESEAQLPVEPRGSPVDHLDLFVRSVEHHGQDVESASMSDDGSELRYSFRRGDDVGAELEDVAMTFAVLVGEYEWDVDRLDGTILDQQGRTIATFTIDADVAEDTYHGEYTLQEYHEHVESSIQLVEQADDEDTATPEAGSTAAPAPAPGPGPTDTESDPATGPDSTPEATSQPGDTATPGSPPAETDQSTAEPGPGPTTPGSTETPGSTPNDTPEPTDTPGSTTPGDTPEPTVTPDDTPESTDTPNDTPEPTGTPNDTPQPTQDDTPESTDTPNDTPEPTDAPNDTPQPTESDSTDTPEDTPTQTESSTTEPTDSPTEDTQTTTQTTSTADTQTSTQTTSTDSSPGNGTGGPENNNSSNASLAPVLLLVPLGVLPYARRLLGSGED